MTSGTTLTLGLVARSPLGVGVQLPTLRRLLGAGRPNRGTCAHRGGLRVVALELLGAQVLAAEQVILVGVWTEGTTAEIDLDALASRLDGLSLADPDSAARAALLADTLGVQAETFDIAPALEAIGAYAARDAAVRTAVTASASTIALRRPVSVSKTRIAPWCEGMFLR